MFLRGRIEQQAHAFDRRGADDDVFGADRLDAAGRTIDEFRAGRMTGFGIGGDAADDGIVLDVSFPLASASRSGRGTRSASGAI
jgi:hypothetical protein